MPFDAANRPTLDPMIAIGYIARAYSTTGGDNWGDGFAHGDFNGDGYGDIGVMDYWERGVMIVYGSPWGLVSGGKVPYEQVNNPTEWAAAEPENRLNDNPTCSTTTFLRCNPSMLWVSTTYWPTDQLIGSIIGAGDTDGDGTDDLVMTLPIDHRWVATPYAGTITIFYGTQAQGLNPNIQVVLRIPPKAGNPNADSRHIGGAWLSWTSAFAANIGKGGDINGDGYQDIVALSLSENSGYVIYGIPGTGSSPTLTAGPYVSQGLCDGGGGYPCTVTMTELAAGSAPNFDPKALIQLSASQPDSCSSATRRCNPTRFDLPRGAFASPVTYAASSLFSIGDVTGDDLTDLVYSFGAFVVNGTYAGGFWILSGSTNGIRAVGAASNKPVCANGSCQTYSFTIPANLPEMQNASTASPYWITEAIQNPSDVDGDGKNDFLISSRYLDSVDANGKKVGHETGGFFLFH
jgi:hypothetical protein